MEYAPDISKLPIPEDDGGCNHLLGEKLPQVLLDSTSGERQQLENQFFRCLGFIKLSAIEITLSTISVVVGENLRKKDLS